MIVAKRMAALVENHGDMGGASRPAVALNIALQHVAKAGDGANGQAIGFARQRGQRVIGAENEGGAVNQMQMASFAESRAHVKMPPKRFARWRHTRRVGRAMPVRYALRSTPTNEISPTSKVPAASRISATRTSSR